MIAFGDAAMWLGWVVAGALGVFGMFNMQNRSRQSQAEQTATNLINNLKTTTDLQEKKIVAMTAKEIEQGNQLAHMQGQIKVLTEILQGRDPAMQAFLTSAPELLRITKENNAMAKESLHAKNALTEAITALLTKITPQKVGQ